MWSRSINSSGVVPIDTTSDTAAEGLLCCEKLGVLFKSWMSHLQFRSYGQEHSPSQAFESCRSEAEYQFSCFREKNLLRWNFPLRFSFIWGTITICISQIAGTRYPDSNHQNRSIGLSQGRENMSRKDRLPSKSGVPQWSNVQSIMQDLSLLLSQSILCNVRSQGVRPTGQVGEDFCKAKKEHTVSAPQLPKAQKKCFGQYVTFFSS